MLPQPAPLVLNPNNTNPKYIDKNFEEISKELENNKTNPKMIYNNPFINKSKNNNNNLIEPSQNYQNPEDMSYEERNAFKFGYPPNMTMQDYVNWLYLFKNNSQLLNLDHLVNFQKLKNNVLIQYIEGSVPPNSKKVPPLNSDNYFNNMYDEMATINNPVKPKQLSSILKSSIESLLPYNYSNYSDFPQNFNTLGSTSEIKNPDLYMKTNPKILSKFIGPNLIPNNITKSTI